MSVMGENKSWATESLKEFPFWRDGMEPEEFDREREYYLKNTNLVSQGKYMPLWKQRESTKTA